MGDCLSARRSTPPSYGTARLGAMPKPPMAALPRWPSTKQGDRTALAFVTGCFFGQPTSSPAKAPCTPWRNGTPFAVPTPPLHLQSITQGAAQVSFGAGDLLPLH
jgi:hypothetical protein